MEAIALSRPGKPLDRQILDRQRHRLCRADYQRMAEAGIFSEDDPIELIAGELVDMPPIGDEHAGLTTQLNHLVHRCGVKDALVSVQNPLVLDDHNEPEPDLMLLRLRADYYKQAKPRAADVLLLIEVADASLSYDRSVKRPLYAQHGIAEVWILNLRDRVVEVNRDPDGQDYRDTWLARAGDLLRPRLVPDLTLCVSELLA
ncbi:MAG: Uma2 family endonuclease [Halochromatium sp.]|uniref:Uma2 family endonuclease n=1 Tax=Halochromatium sp. TaxID=2049430 RepID=UPI003979D082